jgi:hypothetical protein
MWPAHLGTALGRKAESIYLHNIVDILRYRMAACHIEVVVESAQEKIVAKVEILFFAMASAIWKLNAQPMARFR